MNAYALKAKITINKKTVDDVIADLENIKGMKISKSAFYRKMNGKSEFDRKEILALAEVLGMSDEEIMSIFFND